MLIRLAVEADEDALVEMMRADIEETKFPPTGFDESRARETFRSYIDSADPVIFVAEDKRRPIGVLGASIVKYRLAHGHKVICEVLYVEPAYRGSRAATSLLKHVESWARRIGASELIGGCENNFQPERTARLLELHGYEYTGCVMTRRL